MNNIGGSSVSSILDLVNTLAMPYRHISSDLKEWVLCLWNSTGWELEDIYAALGVSSRSAITGSPSCQKGMELLSNHLH